MITVNRYGYRQMVSRYFKSLFSIDELMRFSSARRGSVTIALALVLPILVMFIGLGVEVSMWFQLKRDIQTTADSAAIAGAYEAIELDATTSTVLSKTVSAATANQYDVSTDTLVADNPPATGPNTSETDAVEVNISRPVNLLFASMIEDFSVVISARAVANSAASGEEACALALDTTASGAVSVSGSAVVTMNGCEVATRSTDSRSININGGADLNVDCVATSGDINGSINYTECSEGKINLPVIADPYVDLSMPVDEYGNPEALPCDEDDNISGADINATDSTVLDDDDGDGYVVICGGMTINAGETIDLNPAYTSSGDSSDTVTYIFKEDSLMINGGSNVTGLNTSFLFTGVTPEWAKASVAGGGSINLSASLEGDYAGILFFQDPDSASSPTNGFSFTGDSDTELTGVIYIPNNTVSFSGGNDADDDGCLQLIAKKLSFTGNADIDNKCEGFAGIKPVQTSYQVSLIE
jgi:Flp pilus assembly protein TadG